MGSRRRVGVARTGGDEERAHRGSHIVSLLVVAVVATVPSGRRGPRGIRIGRKKFGSHRSPSSCFVREATQGGEGVS